MPASEPFISKGTIEHSLNCEYLLKTYHFLSFWKSLSSKKTCLYPNALHLDLRTNLSRNADVSENIYMGLINKVDMVCLSPVGYGV